MKIILEQLSFWTGVIASLLLALHIPVSGWAYILFMMSNITTLALLKDTDAPKIISYQIWFFIAINSVGITQWLL